MLLVGRMTEQTELRLAKIRTVAVDPAIRLNQLIAAFFQQVGGARGQGQGQGQGQTPIRRTLTFRANSAAPLEDFEKEVEALSSEITGYDGKHDCPEVRILRQRCFKVQAGLDAADLDPESELRAQRKDILAKVQFLEGILNAKIHAPRCPQCT